MHKINLNQAVLIPTKLLDKLNKSDQQSQNSPYSSEERGFFSQLHKFIEVYDQAKQDQP
ncbi:MAG: hypothetical protein PV340_03650 [Wolbachia sp.]|nr:hypothetical protein [Wolbachia sp.]MDD9336492.1 hypothetical protein [Wolbachia sp.]